MHEQSVSKCVYSPCMGVNVLLPTVSMKTLLNPAVSHIIIASLVDLVTPPRCPQLGDGLMKAFGSLERLCILVLSPRRDPKEGLH